MHTVNRLIDYFQPRHYELRIDLTQADSKQFHGSVKITGETKQREELRLHAKDLIIDRVTVNEVVATATLERDDELVIRSEAIVPGDITISLDFSGTITDSMHGLYPSYYEHDGVKKQLHATQFESHHAREVFPCVDEPAAKATFALTLVTEPGVTALSNTPVKTSNEQAAENGKQKITEFETTPQMSTYLLAFVVGELQTKSMQTARGVIINSYATLAQSADSLDWSLEIATQCIDFYEEYYGILYPLAKSDHVALPDFSAGAMENWGLVTYRESCLLAPPATSLARKRYIATVIAHELAHQWFGNLVTMQWWDELWLNESFANVMEYIALDHLYPEWRAWETFAADELPLALQRDQLSGIQSVAMTINHPDEINAQFDKGIVYAKGSRAIRMAIEYAGEAAFRTGLKHYFETYQYGNTTGDYLWHCIGESADKDVAGFMHAWLTQPNYPAVSVERTANGYRLSQRPFVIGSTPDDRTWPIPIDPTTLLQAATLEIISDSLPDINPQAIGHYIVNYDDASFAEVVDQFASYSIPKQIDTVHGTFLLAQAGHCSTTHLLALLPQLVRGKNDALWSTFAQMVAQIRHMTDTDTALQQEFGRFVEALIIPTYQELGIDETKSNDDASRKIRSTVLHLLADTKHERATAAAIDRIVAVNSLSNLPSNSRAGLMHLAARSQDAETIKCLYDAYRTTTDAVLREELQRALASSDRDDDIDSYIASLSDADFVKPQDVPRWIAWLMQNSHARSKTWTWVQDNWAWIDATFTGDMLYEKFPIYIANNLSTYVERDTYQTFFTAHRNPSIDRSVTLGDIEITTRAQWVMRDAQALMQHLQQ